jgi:1,4-alpha-glucan branching enzyme
VANLSPVPRWNYRVGFPREGNYVELLNSDAEAYGGSGLGNLGGVYAQGQPWDGQPASAELTLPPLSVVWFVAG